jgi:hypothetical protein
MVGVLGGDEPGEGGVAVAIDAPPLTIPDKLLVETRLARLEIRSVLHNRLVTAIKLLSPSNKRASLDGASAYALKRQEIVNGGANLLEIDLLRAGTRVELARPLPAAAYFVFLSRTDNYPLVEIWPIQLRDWLPTVPVPLLRPDPDVVLPLGKLLGQVYHNARYERQVDYREPPPPPEIAPDDLAWLDTQLHEHGLRP